MNYGWKPSFTEVVVVECTFELVCVCVLKALQKPFQFSSGL